jgi:hypothetical protein
MPPPGGMAGMGVSFFGFSATIASVVIKRPAIEAPSCSAMRTTLAGIDGDLRVAGEQLGRRTSSRLILAIDVVGRWRRAL